MAEKKKNNKEKKVTNEKPVSLFPLSLKEALQGLLQTKPPKSKSKPE